MSELTPNLAEKIVAACQAGAEEAAGALSRSLDGEISFTPGESGAFGDSRTADELDGPGLIILLRFGDQGLAAVLPETSSLLPDWCANPDTTGKSKLSTLAQELSMLLVPESMVADNYQAAWIENIQSAISSASLTDDAAIVPIALSTTNAEGQLSLLWPLSNLEQLFPTSKDVEATNPTTPHPAGESTGSHAKATESLDFSRLPGYSRSLLKISLPVSVMLATKKENLKTITELAPGTILEFDKSCDEMLELFVGNQSLAEGEAVKVGDKFGFRVNTIQLPEEHFMKVQPKYPG